jgi:prevent-host-death family protein
MRTFTATYAKRHFGAILDATEREPVKITRYGKLAAYLVSAKKFESMRFNDAFAKAKDGIAINDSAVMDVLTRYSQCFLRKEDAIEALGIQYYGQLLDLLGIADLPMPVVPKRMMNQMVKEALAMLNCGKE